jgi:hypothetical protein
LITLIDTQLPVSILYYLNFVTWSAHRQQSSFKACSALRVLHFRTPSLRLDTVDANTNFPDNKDMATWWIQRFATGVFTYMEEHGYCSDLKIVVVGSHVDVDKPGVFLHHIYPRHCFVKGYQTDVLNRSTVVAVPVPAYMVRQLEPDCDLLDYDPGCDWIGGWSTRIRDT